MSKVKYDSLVFIFYSKRVKFVHYFQRLKSYEMTIHWLTWPQMNAHNINRYCLLIKKNYCKMLDFSEKSKSFIVASCFHPFCSIYSFLAHVVPHLHCFVDLFKHIFHKIYDERWPKLTYFSTFHYLRCRLDAHCPECCRGFAKYLVVKNTC